jgi:thiamine pyrophosphokinase
MRALIFANGDPASLDSVRRWKQPDSIMIAADGGTLNALEAGLAPDVVIGDLDSLPDPIRADLQRRGVAFIVHPARKDQTDLELAIGHALDRGAADIVIFSALGGRWDHSLGNILLLATLSIPARIVDPHQTLLMIKNGAARIEGRIGDALSLIALGGDAHGVTIEGCEYPLRDAILPFGAGLGISNVLLESEARVRVREGIVLVIHSGKT